MSAAKPRKHMYPVCANCKLFESLALTKERHIIPRNWCRMWLKDVMHGDSCWAFVDSRARQSRPEPRVELPEDPA